MPREHPTATPLHVVRAPEDLLFASKCVAGDRAALRELFQRERQRVHALLYRVVGSNAHIEDLLQDTFLEVFRSLSSYRGEASLRTWIDRCAIRAAYAYFGRKARLPQLEPVLDPIFKGPNAEERASLREAARRLYAELDKLETKQRLAFTLFAIEGLPLNEIAKMMEASLMTTKTRVWRARRAIEKRARKDALLVEFLADDKGDEKDAESCEET
ncbi:MAG TPA: RNA polymerase sigma factor [Polyangiaceae bacterium]|nr:RNA polymerase sigma factor [Polyangiaceae bacterium]